MADELAYVLITPYSLHKSRTGGILARLLSRSGLDLAGGAMLAPTRETVETFAAGIVTETDDRHRPTQELLRRYVLEQFSPDPETGARRRTLLLILQGENAVDRTLQVAGHMAHGTTRGETIRDTYGDYLTAGDAVTYFEPGVVVAPTREAARRDLALWASCAEKDACLQHPSASGSSGPTPEQTLVLLKPDNFRFPNARAGHAIDLFSSSGLTIVGFKVHRMSVSEAMDFYGPVLPTLREIYTETTGEVARVAVEQQLGVDYDAGTEAKLGALLGPRAGEARWERLIEFMTGSRPGDVPASERDRPGTQKCVALVYQGIGAVRKIRNLLGPTDPAKAPPGTIRRELGETLMINAAHASDSPANARREMEILSLHRNNLNALVESHQTGA